MNKNIKLLFLLLTISISFPSIAQENIVSIPKHEIRIGIGGLLALPYNNNYDYYNILSLNDFTTNFTNDHYNQLLYNNGDRRTTGAISFNYTYNISRWISLGATFTYAGDYQKIYSRITKEEIGRNNKQHFILTPTLRLNYINKPLIRLYSQIGVGVGYAHHQSGNDKQDDYLSNFIFPTAQFTFIGISLGRKFFGFAELGYGSQGSASAGIGYKY